MSCSCKRANKEKENENERAKKRTPNSRQRLYVYKRTKKDLDKAFLGVAADLDVHLRRFDSCHQICKLCMGHELYDFADVVAAVVDVNLAQNQTSVCCILVQCVSDSKLSILTWLRPSRKQACNDFLEFGNVAAYMGGIVPQMAFSSRTMC